MHQISVAYYNLQAMPLINPVYNNCADTKIKNTLILLTFNAGKIKQHDKGIQINRRGTVPTLVKDEININCMN